MAESESASPLKEGTPSQSRAQQPTPPKAQGQGVIEPPPQLQFASATPQHGDESEEQEKKGRRKISIQFIENKSRRHITFSKRKAGIMKKVCSVLLAVTLVACAPCPSCSLAQAYELATLTGTQVLLLVASETGHVYTFATPKLQPLITNPDGKNLIQVRSRALFSFFGNACSIPPLCSLGVPQCARWSSARGAEPTFAQGACAAGVRAGRGAQVHSHAAVSVHALCPAVLRPGAGTSSLDALRSLAQMYLPEEHYKMQHRVPFPPGMVPPNFQYGTPFPPSFHPGMQPGQQHAMRAMPMPSQYHPQQGGDFYQQQPQNPHHISQQQREESGDDDDE